MQPFRALWGDSVFSFTHRLSIYAMAMWFAAIVVPATASERQLAELTHTLMTRLGDREVFLVLSSKVEPVSNSSLATDSRHIIGSKDLWRYSYQFAALGTRIKFFLGDWDLLRSPLFNIAQDLSIVVDADTQITYQYSAPWPPVAVRSPFFAMIWDPEHEKWIVTGSGSSAAPVYLPIYPPAPYFTVDTESASILLDHNSTND